MAPAALRVLRIMAAAHEAGDFEKAEIVADRSAWLGGEQVPARVVVELIAHLSISHSEDGGLDHYSINGVGQAISRRPQLAEEVIAAIGKRKALTIVDDRIQEL